MKNKKIFYIYILFIGILILSSVGLTIISTVKGSEISYLEKQKQALKSEQEELLSKSLVSESLTQIAATSDKLGLVKPQVVLYLNQEPSVASLR